MHGQWHVRLRHCSLFQDADSKSRFAESTQRRSLTKTLVLGHLICCHCENNTVATTQKSTDNDVSALGFAFFLKKPTPSPASLKTRKDSPGNSSIVLVRPISSMKTTRAELGSHACTLPGVGAKAAQHASLPCSQSSFVLGGKPWLSPARETFFQSFLSIPVSFSTFVRG